MIVRLSSCCTEVILAHSIDFLLQDKAPCSQQRAYLMWNLSTLRLGQWPLQAVFDDIDMTLTLLCCDMLMQVHLEAAQHAGQPVGQDLLVGGAC